MIILLETRDECKNNQSSIGLIPMETKLYTSLATF
jgi:hypothetical protein